MSVTAQTIRDYANWPDKVLDPFLTGKLPSATRQVQRETSLNVPPVGLEDEWNEAVTLLCIARSLPFLHTFTQPGAAYAVQSAQSARNKFQYLDAENVTSSVERAEKRALELIHVIRRATGSDDGSGDFSAGGFYMGAI